MFSLLASSCSDYHFSNAFFLDSTMFLWIFFTFSPHKIRRVLDCMSAMTHMYVPFTPLVPAIRLIHAAVGCGRTVHVERAGAAVRRWGSLIAINHRVAVTVQVRRAEHRGRHTGSTVKERPGVIKR